MRNNAEPLSYRTVRELGGEIWSELRKHFSDRMDWELQIEMTDLIMRILARHDGKMIQNDADLPVIPLPIDNFNE